MGYEAWRTNSSGPIIIPTQNIPALEAALVDKNEESGLSWVHDDVEKGALAALDLFGFTVKESPLGGIVVSDFEMSKIGGDWDWIMTTLALHMDEGTRVTWEMKGEDEHIWRIHLTGGEGAVTTAPGVVYNWPAPKDAAYRDQLPSVEVWST